MPRKSTEPAISCEHFTWRLFRRSGVFYADGRTGRNDLGKHSLGTRDRSEALERLRRLDRQLAVDRGLAKERHVAPAGNIPIEQGWALHFDDRGLPHELGGVKEESLQRYSTVRDKHVIHSTAIGLKSWDQVDRNAVLQHGAWLKRNYDLAPATIKLELDLICSVVKWLAEHQRIPVTCPFKLGLPKIEDSDTYCYRREEVAAMIERCRTVRGLSWLAELMVALATTGVRIGELAAMRWTDIDTEANVLKLTDERFSKRRKQLGNARFIKGKRSRTIPINPAFRDILQQLPRNPDGLVFHGPRGGKLKPDTVRNILIREVIAPLVPRFPTPTGEIGFECGRIHSFRHYFVSEAFRLGVIEARIMEWVGHRDSRIVRRYRHLRDDDGQQKMQELDFLGIEKSSNGSGASV